MICMIYLMLPDESRITCTIYSYLLRVTWSFFAGVRFFFFVPAAGLFSRSLLRARGEPAYTPRAGVQSREIWQVTSGSLPDPLDQTRRMQTSTMSPFFSFFFSPLCFCCFKYHGSRQRLGSRGTTAALQAFPVVTATNGASACGFVRMRVCTRFIVGSYKGLRRQPGRPPVAGLRMRKMLAMVW